MSKLADHHSRIQTEIRTVLPAFFHTEISCSYRNLAPKSHVCDHFPLDSAYLFWHVWTQISYCHIAGYISPHFFHPFDLPPSLLVDLPPPTRSGAERRSREAQGQRPISHAYAPKSAEVQEILMTLMSPAGDGRDGRDGPGSVVVLEQKGRDQNLDHMTGEETFSYTSYLRVPCGYQGFDS